MSRRWPQRAIAIRSRYWARMTPDGRTIRAFLPAPRRSRCCAGPIKPPWSLVEGDTPGLFEGLVSEGSPYLLRIKWPQAVQETEDPYSFGPLLGELDLHLFNEGRHFHLARRWAPMSSASTGSKAWRFAVWAPNAARVAVIGDFNSWDTRRHPMRLRFPSGIWEVFVPRLAAGALYKFDILGPGGVRLPAKADRWRSRPSPRRPRHRSWPRRGPSAGPMIGGWQACRAAIADRADFRYEAHIRIMDAAGR